MKKFILILILSTLLLVSCNSSTKLKDISITEEKVTEMYNIMRKPIEEAGLGYGKDKLYVPEILIKKNENFDIDVYRNNDDLGNISINFQQPDNNHFHIDSYDISAMNITVHDIKPSLPEYITKLKRIKSGNEFYIHQAGSNIMMTYFINRNTTFILFAEIEETEMTQELAEQIYDDFQVISLKELEKVAKK